MKDENPELRGDGTTITATPIPESVPPSSPMARGTSFGRYLVLERLGAGGMGVVYAAYDPDLDRKVAVKILRPDAASEQPRLVREARAMARVQHPNVIAVHDVGTVDGRVFLAMELVDGATLSAWLEERSRSWREALDVMVQAGRGLAAAHAAGVVHRDFKPGNVLVGRDGRVRVVDLGLARGVDGENAGAEERPPGASSPSPSPALSDTITRSGAVVGTPTYMSPEQLLGRPADARSDQFSFSVALYRTLYGDRPFEGNDLRTIGEEVTRGRIKPPPRDSRVPGWLREIVLRGLATAPEQRWPSMDALLAALSRTPERRRRRWLTAGGAVVATVALALGYRGLAGRELRACRSGDGRAATVWGEQQKQAARAAFAATRRPYAAEAAAVVAQALDRYASAWASMHADACEITHRRGEQSAQLLDLRMECLDRRRDALATFVDTLAHADAKLVDDAVTATQRMPPIEDCGNSALLKASIRPALDATVRARLEPLRKKAAQAWAIDAAGHYREALTMAEGLPTDAKALAYRPFEAEALLLLGTVQDDLDDSKAAAATLRAAVLAADSCHHDEVAAKAATLLVKMVGIREHQLAQAKEWVLRARAALEAIGGNDAVEAQLLNHEGMLLRYDAKYDEARARLREAMAIRARIYGKSSVPVANVLDNLGAVEVDAGRYPEALEQLQRALAMKESLVGRDHPALTSSLQNLGVAFNKAGRYEDALAVHRRVAIIEQKVRGESVKLAMSLSNVAIDLYGLERYTESLAANQRALELYERLLGRDHPETARPLNNIALVYTELHRNDEAEAALARARDIYAKHPSINQTDAIYTDINLGNALRRRGKLTEARTLLEDVHARATRIFGTDHRLTASALFSLGLCRADAHQPATALPSFEQALAIFRRIGISTERLASMQLDLAKALWATGRREEARRALAVGREDVRATPSSKAAKEIGAWTSSHP